MNWDSVLLTVLAVSGCVTLLLTQADDILTRLPRLIRAWRNVRGELRDGGNAGRAAEDPPGEPPAGRGRRTDR
ncbi:hypothetical protein [Streptomyces griseus]|uniref:hypothetical protein n=1 Tax=Streptomyces griseus TaxID=1911 RepID=UPI00055E1808|nr:hypothetical protein [Streptomyces griseus]